jgi:DNA topoisomerase-1
MPPKTAAQKKQSSKQTVSDNFLLIVESPSKCAKIESYLGEKYQCISSKGHIREIDGLSSINTKDRFQIEYTPIKDKRDHIEILKSTVKKYSPANILLATDDDREGEAIAWHICQVCGLDLVQTKRIVFHEITQPALLEAVANPTRINLSLVAAQQARQVLDLIVGFKISPLLWRNLGSNRKNALSAGRCQTPALRLIFDHHQKYKAASAQNIQQIHRISAIFTNRGIKFDLSVDLTSQESLLDFLEKSKTHEHRLTIGKTRPSIRSPPKPFNTSRLLQTASNQFRLSPKRTMELCQTLYQSGLITYMRTECQKYSDVFLQKIANHIRTEYGEAYVGDFSNIILLDTTMPHEGIRVTNIALKTMTSNDPMLSKMYSLIWKNTVESCMATAKYNMTDYMVDCPHPPHHLIGGEAAEAAEYKYTMETPVFLGWRKIEIKDATGVQTTESSLALYLEQISKTGSPLTWSLIESKVAVDSRMPHHYTEASLIQTLEDLGIGRPSTFSSIVETIQERGYAKKTDVKGIVQKCAEYKLRQIYEPTKSTSQHTIEKTAVSSQYLIEKTESEKTFGDERDKLVIQPTGILVLEFLLQHFDDCFSYDYTRTMETELDVLSSQPSEQALESWHHICRKCFDDITERSKPLAKQTKQTFALSDTADHVLVFNTYGASIKNTATSQYSKTRPEIELDLEKAKRGEYTMAELIWREDNGYLGVLPGKYKDKNENENKDDNKDKGYPVYLKKGKFGLYAEWENSSGKQTISLKPLNKTANEISLKDVIRVIEKKTAPMSQEDAAAMFLPQSDLDLELELDLDDGCCDLTMNVRGYGQEQKSTTKSSAASGGGSEKSLLRSLRPDLSIRKGKFGPYIFHKTSQMSAPKFHPIKPLKDKWEKMSNLELIAAIENTYHLSI